MSDIEAEIHGFLEDRPRKDGDPDSIALVMARSSIVEYEGELCPGVSLSPGDARLLAGALADLANEAGGVSGDDDAD